jgi:RimJ/RimL family protein N-acetyltransferase
MHLQLSRSTIRDWRSSLGTGDRDALVRHANNPAVARNMRDRFPSPYGERDAEQFLALCEHQSPRTYFAIEVNGEAAGGIGLTLHDDIERVSAELGYWLGETYWSRGIVSEAVIAMTDWAFVSFPLTRIYAVPFARNLASTRILEKAGYSLEGRLRRSAIKQGEVLDQLIYARVR